MRPATIRRLLARPTFAAELELHRLDVMASHRRTDNYVRLLDALAALAAEPPVPPPLLRGRDLLDLGLAPGPGLGEILRAVQERQLNGELRSPQEALAWVRRERIPPRPRAAAPRAGRAPARRPHSQEPRPE
jgi:poly(A) polymerase